jgi:hypothetical protein
MMEVRFPNVEVQLSGEDGNAFFIVGKVKAALRRGGASREEQAEFLNEAMSGDYDHVLQTCMKWVNVS